MSNSNIVEIDFKKPPNRIFTEIKKHPWSHECHHTSLAIDIPTDTVYCRTCDERLSPMWVLTRIAEKHDRLYWEYASLYAKGQQAQDMNRCKCQHCGKMTQIIKSK